MTLAEYLADYASAQTRAKGLVVLERELARVSDASVGEVCRARVEEILSSDARDFRF